LADHASAIQLDPKNAEASHDRGDLQLGQGRLEAAYSDAPAINEGLASAYNGRGNALRETEQVESAIQDYNTAISLDPKSPFTFELWPTRNMVLPITRTLRERVGSENHFLVNGLGLWPRPWRELPASWTLDCDPLLSPPRLARD
jgi:tetratricopeptide (TPR) repeat protein